MRAIHVPILAAIALAMTACDSKVSEGMNPGECTDGADNDGNGAFDCDDPGCASSPDCEDDGSTGGGTGGGPGTATGGDPGTGTGGGTGDPGGGTGDPGGGTGDPGGGTGGDPGGNPGGGTGGGTGGTGGTGGGPGGGTGGGPGGGTGGSTGGGPGGGTAGTGGTGGTGGGTGGGPGAYDGAYIGLGGITVTLDHPSLGTDSCTGDFDIELFGTNVIDGNVSNCTLSGPLSGFGSVSTTVSGTVDASGNVSGQFDTLGPISFTGSSDGTNFSGTVNDTFSGGGATVTVTGTMSATK